MSVFLRKVREDGRSSTLLPPLSGCPSRRILTTGADFTLTDTVSRSELNSDSDSLVYLALPGLVLRLSEEDASRLPSSILNIMSSGSALLDRDDVLVGLWVDFVARCLSGGRCLMEAEVRTMTLSPDPDHHGRVGALWEA
jgi:hypothetical protein